jgi:hypothetical protein
MSTTVTIFILKSLNLILGSNKKATTGVTLGGYKTIYYFLGLPSPSMIHRAEKLVLSSILNAYIGSTFFVLPDSH